jgi:hypothetical protein
MVRRIDKELTVTTQRGVAMGFVLLRVTALFFIAIAMIAAPCQSGTPGATGGGVQETGIHPGRQSAPPEGTTLFQNQPNPASSYTVIYFYLAQSGPASLKLFNPQGRMAGYFFDGYQLSGWYTLWFNPDFLTKGEYFYRLTTSTKILLKKMVVVK